MLCLLVAGETGSASPSELSDLIGTSRSNITRIIEDLETRGWVKHSVAPRDARRFIITVTDPGRSKVIDTVPRIAPAIQRAFSTHVRIALSLTVPNGIWHWLAFAAVAYWLLST